MCICVLHFSYQLPSSSECLFLPHSHEYGDLETGEVLCGCSQVSTFGIGSICFDVTL